jgi:sec-independent protein translocase protein TatA
MIYLTFLFLNLGGGELFIIVLFIILFFGSDKLPEIAKGLGKGIREINNAKAQIQSEIQKSTSGFKEEIEKHTSQIRSEIENVEKTVKTKLNDTSTAIAEESKKITDTLKD